MQDLTNPKSFVDYLEVWKNELDQLSTPQNKTEKEIFIALKKIFTDVLDLLIKEKCMGLSVAFKLKNHVETFEKFSSENTRPLNPLSEEAQTALVWAQGKLMELKSFLEQKKFPWSTSIGSSLGNRAVRENLPVVIGKIESLIASIGEVLNPHQVSDEAVLQATVVALPAEEISPPLVLAAPSAEKPIETLTTQPPQEPQPPALSLPPPLPISKPWWQRLYEFFKSLFGCWSMVGTQTKFEPPVTGQAYYKRVEFEEVRSGQDPLILLRQASQLTS